MVLYVPVVEGTKLGIPMHVSAPTSVFEWTKLFRDGVFVDGVGAMRDFWTTWCSLDSAHADKTLCGLELGVYFTSIAHANAVAMHTVFTDKDVEAFNWAMHCIMLILYHYSTILVERNSIMDFIIAKANKITDALCMSCKERRVLLPSLACDAVLRWRMFYAK